MCLFLTGVQISVSCAEMLFCDNLSRETLADWLEAVHNIDALRQKPVFQPSVLVTVLSVACYHGNNGIFMNVKDVSQLCLCIIVNDTCWLWTSRYRIPSNKIPFFRQRPCVLDLFLLLVSFGFGVWWIIERHSRWITNKYAFVVCFFHQWSWMHHHDMLRIWVCEHF